MAKDRKRIAVSGKERAVLSLLARHERLYGLELVRMSDGELKRGTVYVTLQRAEGKGLVQSELEPKPVGVPGRARRLYSITKAGEAALEAVLQLDALLTPAT